MSPEGGAYWRTVHALAKRHGFAVGDDEGRPPSPRPQNVLVLKAWGYVWPDCREHTINGLGFFDWGQVESVLRAYGIPWCGYVHHALRVMLFEAMKYDKRETDGK